MIFSFTIKLISFFFFLYVFNARFKKTEYNPICTVFTEAFLIVRIPHSTVLISEAVVQRCSVKKVF